MKEKLGVSQESKLWKKLLDKLYRTQSGHTQNVIQAGDMSKSIGINTPTTVYPVGTDLERTGF